MGAGKYLHKTVHQRSWSIRYTKYLAWPTLYTTQGARFLDRNSLNISTTT